MVGDWSAFAAMVANAVIIGWLVPSVIERRSLREMGWQVNFWAIVTAAFAGLAVFVHMAQWPYGPQAAVAVLVAAFISAGCREENLFRGHLMPTLQENGISPLNANLIQAAVFSAGHLPWLVAPVLSWSPADFIIFGWGSLVKWFVWGLLFGWLRMRTRSIIPAVAAHGLLDHILFVGYLSD